MACSRTGIMLCYIPVGDAGDTTVFQTVNQKLLFPFSNLVCFSLSMYKLRSELLRAYFSRRLSATQKSSWKGTNHVCRAY